MNAAYVLEITSQCSHKGQVNLSGNAYNLSSLAAICQVCGKPAQINSAQEVGLDPLTPGFEERVEKLTAEFSTFTYYLVTVADRQVKMELRVRKNITVDFLLFCETCQKPITVEPQTQQKLKTEHAGHAVTLTPKGDSIPVGVLLETFRQQMEKFVGQPLVAEKSDAGEDRLRVEWS
jgi:hypothetical protein